MFQPPQKESADYVLPVVVHIIHDNGVENISDAQVQLGIAHLNQAFANEGWYDPATGVKTPFQFCLATRAPDGSATNGIHRIQSETTDGSQFNQQVHTLISWNTNDYVNIWVVRGICTPSSGCSVAAYAYLPASHGEPFDGMVAEAEFFGTTPAKSAVLAHELGHYLGLFHTFEGGCMNGDCLTGGDHVCDTPPDNSTAYLPCTVGENSCMTDVNAADPNNPFTSDQDDQTGNFMDYGNIDCFTIFTQGQSERMAFFLLDARSSLLESAGCQSPCPSPFSVSFSASASATQPGLPVSFTNNSQNVNDFMWAVNGAVFSNGQNAVYTFPDEGVFEIRLTGSNGNPLCPDETFSLTVYCQGMLEVEVEICNTGASTIDPDFPLTFYGTDPTQDAAQPLRTINTTNSLSAGACVMLTWSLNNPPGSQ